MLADGNAILLRQVEIEQDQARQFSLPLEDSVLTIMRHGHRKPSAAQGERSHIRKRKIIFHNQNFHAFPRCLRGNSSQKIEPPPGRAFTPTCPPCASTVVLTTYKPRPMPYCSAAWSCARTNCRKRFVRSDSGIPG